MLLVVSEIWINRGDKMIKLRAWDEGKKVIHYNFKFIDSGEEGNDWIVFTSDKQKLSDTPHPFDNPYFKQQLKISQYIGIKDSRGEEIYEGDNVFVIGEDYYSNDSFNIEPEDDDAWQFNGVVKMSDGLWIVESEDGCWIPFCDMFNNDMYFYVADNQYWRKK
jgi:hypothetical protein